jgi:hypothetical protein
MTGIEIRVPYLPICAVSGGVKPDTASQHQNG